MVIEKESMADDELSHIRIFVNMMSSMKQEISFRRWYPRGAGMDDKLQGGQDAGTL
jgi:hypothetical protein